LRLPLVLLLVAIGLNSASLSSSLSKSSGTSVESSLMNSLAAASLSSSKGLPSLSFTVPAGDTSTSPSGVSTL
jgi:hypothetical protein